MIPPPIVPPSRVSEVTEADNLVLRIDRMIRHHPTKATTTILNEARISREAWYRWRRGSNYPTLLPLIKLLRVLGYRIAILPLKTENLPDGNSNNSPRQ